MEFIESEIRQLIVNVWAAVLRLPLVEGTDQAMPAESPMMAACVQITGGWCGAISLKCDPRFAVRAAGIMFDLKEADVTRADVQDALGELANMLGGNIKGLLPEQCHLSLPTVVDGSDYSLRIPRSHVVHRLAFTCEGMTLNVVLREREPDVRAVA